MQLLALDEAPDLDTSLELGLPRHRAQVFSGSVSVPNCSFDSLTFRGLSQLGASKLPLFVAVCQLCLSVFPLCESFLSEVPESRTSAPSAIRQLRESLLRQPGRESAISELCILRRRLRAAILTRAHCLEFLRAWRRLADGQFEFSPAARTFLSRYCETHQSGQSVATPRMSVAPRKHPRAK